MNCFKQWAAVELVPAQVNNEIAVQPYEQIPLSRLTALGVGLEPITAAVQQVLSLGRQPVESIK